MADEKPKTMDVHIAEIHSAIKNLSDTVEKRRATVAEEDEREAVPR